MEKTREIPVSQSMRRVALFTKTCRRCVATFEGHKLAVYCSVRCRRQDETARYKPRRSEIRRQRANDKKPDTL